MYARVYFRTRWAVQCIIESALIGISWYKWQIKPTEPFEEPLLHQVYTRTLPTTFIGITMATTNRHPIAVQYSVPMWSQYNINDCANRCAKFNVHDIIMIMNSTYMYTLAHVCQIWEMRGLSLGWCFSRKKETHIVSWYVQGHWNMDLCSFCILYIPYVMGHCGHVKTESALTYGDCCTVAWSILQWNML